MDWKKWKLVVFHHPHIKQNAMDTAEVEHSIYSHKIYQDTGSITLLDRASFQPQLPALNKELLRK